MEELTNGLRKIQMLLKFTYGLVPIIAGADKFTNILTKWVDYLNPALANLLPMRGNQFMMLIGIVEIIAGLWVLLKPQKGAYVVCSWLVLIALSLLASGKYLDVAVRDLVMAIGAFSLAKISVLSEIDIKPIR